MRVTTDFWASALTRRVFGQGGFAVILKRGATEAGAVFVTVLSRMGQVTLYGPASQSAYDTAKPDDRLFTVLIDAGDPAAVEARLQKEQRFDPDIWIIELETGSQAVEDLISIGEAG
jgi:hypothetical protein